MDEVWKPQSLYRRLVENVSKSYTMLNYYLSLLVFSVDFKELGFGIWDLGFGIWDLAWLA
jgi:hypothetical protein